MDEIPWVVVSFRRNVPECRVEEDINKRYKRFKSFTRVEKTYVETIFIASFMIAREATVLCSNHLQILQQP